MGLDTVEILMELEDAFAITFPDSEAERLVSVGDTFEYIVARLAARAPRGPCLSAGTFYRLRRELIDRLEVQRSRVRLDARIGDLVPLGELRARWPAVAAEVGLPVPPGRFRLFFQSSPSFPDPLLSVREIVRQCAQSPFYTASGAVDRDVVWRKVLTIVSEASGISQDKIQPASEYVKDLRLD